MIRVMIACGCLDCSDPEMEVKSLRKTKKESSRIKTLDFRRGDFRLLKEPVGGFPLWTALKSKGTKTLTNLQEQPPQRGLVYPIT